MVLGTKIRPHFGFAESYSGYFKHLKRPPYEPLLFRVVLLFLGTKHGPFLECCFCFPLGYKQIQVTSAIRSISHELFVSW